MVDGEDATLTVPLEITKGHKCSVFFSTIVKTLTQDTGTNEFAIASFTLTWDGRDAKVGPDDKDQNRGLGTMKFLPVTLTLADEKGNGTDTVQVQMTMAASTDGAILQSPCSSEVSVQQLTLSFEETT